jgi:hypothetical protein
LQAES